MNIRNYLQKGNSDYHIDFLAEHSLVTRFIMDGPSNRNTKYQWLLQHLVLYIISSII